MAPPGKTGIFNFTTPTFRLPPMSKNLNLGRYDFASYACFTAYATCSLAIPLSVVAMGKSLAFPLDAGGMGAAGFLHMLRSIAMLIMLTICGWIAGKWGKRLTLGYGVLGMGLGILCCAFAQQYWMLMPFLFATGIGEGFIEGIASPFVQDLHQKDADRYMPIAHSFWSVGIAVAVVLVGGLLAINVNWRIILAIIGALSCLSALGFLWRDNPARPYPESGKPVAIKAFARDSLKIFRSLRFWGYCLAMFVGAGSEFGLTFWSAPYLELNFNAGPWVASLGTGAIAFGMFIGRALTGYFSTPRRIPYFLIAFSLGTIPIALALACLSPEVIPCRWLLITIIFVLLILAGIGVAPYWPSLQVHGVNNLRNLDATLLYIYFSALGVSGCGLFTWLLGWLGDRYGMGRAFLIIPASLLVYATIIFLEHWVFRPKSEELE